MKTQFLRIRSIIPVMIGAWTALVGLSITHSAHAQDVRLQDLLQSEFERSFTITGWGLVTGLQGTGDTGGNYAAALNYIERMKRAGFVDQGTLPQAVLKEGSIAVVQVSAEIPNLFGSGQAYECRIAALGGGAGSLEGGTLLVTPLRRSDASIDDGVESIDYVDVIGFAEGVLQVDPRSPTRGQIIRGARLATTAAPIWEEVRGWRSITFDVKNPAHRTMMNLTRLVDAVNEEMLEDGFVDLATVISGGQIKVVMPDSEDDSFRFAGRVLGMSVDFRNVEPPAEIRWNESAGVLVITGNTAIRDATVSIDGFSIQRIEPRRAATIQNPAIELEPFIAMTGRDQPSLSLQTLKRQLDMLKVPVRSQARVLQELCNTGQCNAMFVRAGADG